jgi:hypothetical protein
MSLNTRSAFYYGHIVDETNNNLSFDEGGSELIGVLNVGAYTLTDYANEVIRALNEAGADTYSVVINRATRILTISSDGTTFNILTTSGSTAGTTAWTMAGFTGADKTGSLSYAGDTGSGSAFLPQFLLQSYVSFDDNVRFNKSRVYESASGIVQSVSYGTLNFMECNVKFATNIDQGKNSPIETNLTGEADLRAFLNGVIQKGNIEFIPDRDTPATFTKCVLESTPASKQGTAFVMKELYGMGLAGYWETGKLVFRKQN